MDMVIETVFAALTTLVLLVVIVTEPTSASCPEKWHHEGITPSGDFTCIPNPVGGTDDLNTGPDTAYYPPGKLGGRIHCTNGTVAIVVTDRTVGCQPDHTR